MHFKITQGWRAYTGLHKLKLSGLLFILLGLCAGFVPYTQAHADIKQVVVHYANYNTNPTSATQAQPVFDVVNNSSSSVALSSLNMRYWFTIDTNQPLVFSCYYATVGCNNITATFVTLGNPAGGADHYLQVGFTPGAGSVAAGQDSGQVQVAFHKADWSAFDQTNDFSWNPLITSLGQAKVNPNLGLFQGQVRLDSGPTPAGSPVSVSVDEKDYKIGPDTYGQDVGINVPVYNNHFLDPGATSLFLNNQISPVNQPGASPLVTASLQHGTGTSLFRYPGGGTADVYHWASNSVGPIDPSTPNQLLLSYADPAMNFDAFMQGIGGGLEAGSHVMADIVVNYGSGTPQEAADWVRYANKGGAGYTGPVPTYSGASSTGHHYGVQYWEIGNELYGDGTYGNPFEYIDPKTRQSGPAAYAQGVIDYSAAMKAVDPTIKIGAVLTMPGNFPDDDVASSGPKWDATVLQKACSSIDFVSVHWYPQQPKNPGPGGESDAGLLAASSQQATATSPTIPTMAKEVRDRINQYCGSHANDVKIQVTEMNSVAYNPGKQTTGPINALFLADAFQTWQEQVKYGVMAVYPWAMFNSASTEDFFNHANVANNDPSLYGNTNFGDFGLLSSGDCDSVTSVCAPPVDTPYPSFYGLQMVHFLRGPTASSWLPVTSSNPLVTVHAVLRPDGTMGVMVINKDPLISHPVSISISTQSTLDLKTTLPGPVDLDTYDSTNPNTISITTITPDTSVAGTISYNLTVSPYGIAVINPQEIYL